MHEIIFKRAEKRELSENAWDSREMRETWQVCAIYFRGFFSLIYFDTVVSAHIFSGQFSCAIHLYASGHW